jgi:predicted AlkP superfamily pyrophosphatase or phosphodiesterase
MLPRGALVLPLTALLLAALLPVAGDAAAELQPAAVASTDAPTVIVLSWDGVRHDYPDRHEMPALARMAREGVRAERLVPVFPSSTFPAHVSLATGTYPDRHGIIDNRFIDAERGEYRMSSDANWIEAEPLWIAAERQGIPTATYFWVGSETDWRGLGTRYRIAPFDGSRPEAVKVDQILEWLALPATERPRLIMSYWSGADSAGHRHGPNSRQVAKALQHQDAELQRLLAGLDARGLWPVTTLIIVSDHGMAAIGSYLDLQGALQQAGIAARVTGSAVAQVYLNDAQRLDEALAVIGQMQPSRVYRKEALPAHLRMRHEHRTGDLVVLTDPPYTFSWPGGTDGVLMSAMGRLGASFGGHGYEPDHPDMGGIFFAMGRGVGRGPDANPGAVHQIDLAATVAHLLGIEPPAQSEGRPIPLGDDFPPGSPQ